MKIAFVGKVVLSAALAAAALWMLHYLWLHYKEEPWTRDGKVRADVVQVSPDVSGLVASVNVHDNEAVKAGQLLFVIDKPRFALALDQARSAVDNMNLQLAQARRENSRDKNLGELVSAEVKEQSTTRIDQLRNALTQAETTLALAKLNLERTEVRAGVDGIVTNLELHAGEYAPAGKAQLALIDSASTHVVAYFEETKIARFKVGDPAHVRLMGERRVLDGRVDSIAGAIEDRDRSSSAKLLASVTPTFNWIRLAQRIPVRIKIDRAPPDMQLIAGRSATVDVVPAPAPRAAGAKS
ncbi:MAG: efflux transporter periplasmic adaptor subunit [Herbaspirillum sp.]|jgi:RND family efflux transporter MFP subunit|nr:efflux transporter periplasmic adaptor subunit [Herbaspirillum sp.]